MEVAGFEEKMFKDDPLKTELVIWIAGCNYNCFYCHNKHISKLNQNKIEFSVVFEHIKKRKNFLDAVVFTGGEPTLHPDLKIMIKKVKETEIPVVLDTNGTNPKVVEDLIEENLLNFIAMDIKCTFDKYESITKANPQIDNVKKTIKIIEESGILHKFRTAKPLEVTDDDIKEIQTYIKSKLEVNTNLITTL